MKDNDQSSDQIHVHFSVGWSSALTVPISLIHQSLVGADDSG